MSRPLAVWLNGPTGFQRRRSRLGSALTQSASPEAENPLGARAIYLYQGNKDTLYRIHGTNQPEYIGQAISSGCIRMTNEDVIDLVNRVKPGAIVVVLPPGRARERAHDLIRWDAHDVSLRESASTRGCVAVLPLRSLAVLVAENDAGARGGERAIESIETRNAGEHHGHRFAPQPADHRL